MTRRNDSEPLVRRKLGQTDLEIVPLVFGGNVFGWTVDRERSFALLDRVVDAGLDAIDTADIYSTWVPGNQGGESETIIGQWLKADASRRDKVKIFTKVGGELASDGGGLTGKRILKAADDSLRRLQTDRIDVYFSHFPDEKTPVEETLRAYETLIRQGKVRVLGASNYSVSQLREALATSAQAGLPRYDVLQPEYNLYDRAFEGELRDLAVAEGLGVVVYYSLASGFLTGKYRSENDLGKSARGGKVARYLDAKGLRILDALDAVAKAHDALPAEVAVAWLLSREGVTAPIASATTVEQVDSLVRAVRLKLTPEDLARLDAAGVEG